MAIRKLKPIEERDPYTASVMNEEKTCSTCESWPSLALGAARVCMSGQGVTVAEARACDRYVPKEKFITPSSINGRAHPCPNRNLLSRTGADDVDRMD